MAHAQQRYHSDFKVQYCQGGLPPEMVKKIPRSTRQRWREKEEKKFWMPTPEQHNIIDELTIKKLQAENRQLKIKLKALYYIVMLYKELIALLKPKARHGLQIKKGVELILRFCWENNLDKKVWRFLPFSFKQWHSWEGLRSCLNSLQGYCRKQNVGQLTLQEQVDLQRGCSEKEIKNWPLISVYYYLLRQKKISFSLGAFYKYCRLLKITRRKHKRRKHYVPIAATAPLKILHQDITIFRTLDGVKRYVYVIKDNFSRAILACKVTTEYSSEIARQTFDGVLQRFGLLKEEGFLITDGGMENKGALDEMLSRPGMLWKRLTAQIDIIQSNCMVEAANKILKYRYLYPKHILNGVDLAYELKKAVEEFNSMPNGQLLGLTPNEVLSGEIPTRGNYKEQIYLATLERMEENRQFECGLSCHF
ncbi:transposase family protein [Taibaiella lutea]|uniref:Transposase family protein n=1 Tax=Taibaiella lutea TaxID=2608001 RepID=A0A5M6CM37_9BACT|nr:DDE-type integrase/transposase/recombinase [Taibaiella lutea]KAA5536194.1 transposase family protein [Taibaiella lutea]